jgi:hypothetical protein
MPVRRHKLQHRISLAGTCHKPLKPFCLPSFALPFACASSTFFPVLVTRGVKPKDTHASTFQVRLTASPSGASGWPPPDTRLPRGSRCGEHGKDSSWMLGPALGAPHYTITISGAPQELKPLPTACAFKFINWHGLTSLFIECVQTVHTILDQGEILVCDFGLDISHFCTISPKPNVLPGPVLGGRSKQKSLSKSP